LNALLQLKSPWALWSYTLENSNLENLSKFSLWLSPWICSIPIFEAFTLILQTIDWTLTSSPHEQSKPKTLNSLFKWKDWFFFPPTINICLDNPQLYQTTLGFLTSSQLNCVNLRWSNPGFEHRPLHIKCHILPIELCS
jgi:hypothetical protein